MAKTLVTGATGFIGPHLVEALRGRGDEVTCLVRRTSRSDRLDKLGVRLVYGDITQPETLSQAVQGVDVVYQLAGLVKSMRSADMWRVNEQGVHNLAAACAACSSPPVLVAVSSLAAAGPAPRGRLRSESDPARPVSHYGRSKRAGELALARFADRLPITVVRPPIVFGEGDENMLWMVDPIVRLRLHLVPGIFDRTYSLVHAADLSQALVLAAERGSRLVPEQTSTEAAPPGYYFAAFDEHPSYAQLGRLISQAAGCGRPFNLRSPRAATLTMGCVAEGVMLIRRKPMIFNFDKAREAIAGSWACSPKRAMDELGFRPGGSLLERLRETIDWYYEQGWLKRRRA